MSRLGTNLNSSAALPNRGGPSKATANALVNINNIRERRNWLIHQLFVRQEYADCLSVIEAQLRDTEGTCEYALYVKGLLRRTDGKLTESLILLQAAVLVSPENAANRKQLGRALFLLGRHAEAIEMFEEAERIRLVKGVGEDWELPHATGICHTFLKNYARAIEAFKRSLSIQRTDAVYLSLAHALMLSGDAGAALLVYEEASSFSPENSEVLALLGHLHLEQGNTKKAIAYLGRCLSLDPTNAAAIMATSSVMQDRGECDVALAKYRIIVKQLSDSPQLWSNIGACFFGKQNAYAAVACLRKALYLDPFEWIVQYNMGVVNLTMGRYASAFHYLSAAVSLHHDYAPAFMFLGVCLSFMNDIDNACCAYDTALKLDNDLLIHLNYAVTLWNSGMAEAARHQLHLILPVWENLSEEEEAKQSVQIPAVLQQLQACLAAAGAPAAHAEQAPAENNKCNTGASSTPPSPPSDEGNQNQSSPSTVVHAKSKHATAEAEVEAEAAHRSPSTRSHAGDSAALDARVSSSSASPSSLPTVSVSSRSSSSKSAELM